MGDINDIAKAEYQLMAAYPKDPNDPKLAANIGFLNFWKSWISTIAWQRSPNHQQHHISKTLFYRGSGAWSSNPFYKDF